jgi:hypothetical protein
MRTKMTNNEEPPIKEPKKKPAKKSAAAVKTGVEDVTLKCCWPQYIQQLLSCCDVAAQTEQNAKNTENVKGNKWAHLLFVYFGGN